MKKLIMAVIVVMFAFTLTAYDWPDSEKDAYTYSCVAKGGTLIYCWCTMGWLMKRFSATDLNKITIQDMLDAAASCRGVTG